MNTLLAYFTAQWLTMIHVVCATSVTVHALFNKRDVRSAIGWMGLAWLSPITGSLLYVLFGINRVQRKAYRILRRRQVLREQSFFASPSRSDHLAPLEHAVGIITNRPVQSGNAVDLLRNGDEVYPAMLAAIKAARTSIALSSYIFRADTAGVAFIAALIEAQTRKVDIRVIVDGVGSGYFHAPAFVRLRRHGIHVARFIHSFLPWRMGFLNLRNHRKILVVDGNIAFLGGINISVGHLFKNKPRHPIRDVHFRVTGPVVAQIMEAFAADWFFTTAEELKGTAWFPPLEATGRAEARVITSGPDQDIDKIELMFLQAIGCARHAIKIATPYFLPEDRLITALSLAAMRGVAVEIVIPANSDHAVIDWATRAHIAPLLAAGGQIWRAPKPFDHSKLLTVDDSWSLIGSANWDVRSMRLNFEINLEVFDSGFAALIGAEIDRKKGSILTLARLGRRPLLIRLRDRAARLLLPYL